MSEHKLIGFVFRPVRGSVRAECKCGWQGPERMTREKASEDHADHAATEGSDRG